ncbi:MAG: hypothetical protein K6F53_07790 [Lachnospiraceae bacterium]|nr:hypothetical protein [Lachnospiraceae bacterium]
MRYFFKSTIDKNGDHYNIRIPFNIWEVCKQREVIDGEIMLDNKYIACKLIPSEKGNYSIDLTAEDVAHMDLSKKHDLLLHVSGSLIKMNQNSPYSVENPIRKIDHIDIIIQPMDGVCGQTVVAMLAGVTIADVSKTMGIREWQATMGVVISALNYYGIDHNDIIVYTEGEPVTLPKCAVLMEKMGRFSHYLLYFDGKYYDPNDGIFEDYDQSKLLGYLEIYTE